MRAALGRPAAARPDAFAAWCPHYLPRYYAGPAADFHASLFARLDAFHHTRGQRYSLVAPRGSAKSTTATLAYPLRAALEGWEPYTVILSDSANQANQLLGHVRRELEHNDQLATDYPDAFGRGPVWRDNRIELRNGAVIEALGSGSRIRGRRTRQARPSLVVLDDVQSNEDTISALARQRAWDWVTREVIPAGDGATNFLSVGSAIHSEAVAVRVGQLPGWSAETRKAVHSWPARLDLWAECERLATNLADPDRDATSRAFYAAHPEMDDDASVYWPERYPLFDLMMRRAEIGAAAFDSEYQGVPNLGGLTEWPAEYWDDRPGVPFWFDQWPGNLAVKVMALDPSKGEGPKSDYQALAYVGYGTDGCFYLDVDLQREPVTAMVRRCITAARAWQANSVLVEQNATLGLLKAEFEEQLKGTGPLPVEYLTSVEQKEVRILSDVGPYLSRGQVRVRRTRGGQALADQGRQFPHGDYDDALDAVSLGIRRVVKFYGG